jgi:hypothetical protein
VDLDLVTTREEESGAGLLFTEHFQECRSPEAEKPVNGPGGRNAQVASMAHLCLAVDLDQHLTFEDTEDLVGLVVAMEVPNVISLHCLDAHDEPPQTVLMAGDDANVAGSHRERHRSRPAR